MKEIPLGFEIGSGTPVAIPLRHLAVTGQTQESGKTTTLEALVARSGLRAVAFVTKRAEGAFQDGRRIPAYFKERADWQFVSAVLEATFREKMRFERAWIMRACKGAKTLADVAKNVRAAIADPKVRGLSADIYMTLEEYLKVVVPQIDRLRYTETLTLEPGLNVMDLTAYSTELQALVVRSVLEWIYERERDTVTIIPEAWEFLPEGRGSPVLYAAEALIRKSAAAGNYVWLDSQDIAGVRKVILKSVIIWLIGVQREANEVKRVLAHIPTKAPKPTAAEVMALGRGQFIACWGAHVKRVYVQPTWMSADDAQRVAKSGGGWVPEVARRIDKVERVFRGQTAQVAIDQIIDEYEEDKMDRQERERYEEHIAALTTKLEAAQKTIFMAGEEARRLRMQVQEFADAGAALSTLRRLLGRPTVAAGDGQAVDIETVVAEVLRRVPVAPLGGVVYEVAPIEKLRKDYQTKEVGRIMETVRALSITGKDVLALLEMTEGFLSQAKIAQRLGKGPGGWLVQHLKPMEEAGLVEIAERQGCRGRLRHKIGDDLAHYGATEAEIEQTYQAVLAEVATRVPA